jgi:uncharacterized protein (DUF1786 family)
MFEGQLLALDVGGGTQDLLIWEPGEPVENAVKLVLPAPTQILARRLRALTAQDRPVFLQGRLMGGGAVTQAAREHLARGLPLYATPQAALTLNDRLDLVRGWGVILTQAPPPDAAPLTLGDVDLETLTRLLDAFAVSLPPHFAVAVQDHGFSPEMSNRRFRFQYWEDFLHRQGHLQDLAFLEPPAFFTRMRAVAEALPGALLMDTCAAGVRGALLDPQARPHLEAGLTVLNLGNAHTFAALVQGERIFGIYEHHTGLLTPAKLLDHLARFQAGELTNDEVFAHHGHGCAYAPGLPRGRGFAFTVVTGPRRRLARGVPGAVFAAPGGDLMLTGCFGLTAAFLERQKFPVNFAAML